MNDINEMEIPKITKCGFRNIGNTCYMNSTLQLLVHNKLLLAFFIDTIKNQDQNSIKKIEKDGKAKFKEYLKEAAKQRLGDEIRRKNKLDKDAGVEILARDYNDFIENSVSESLHEIMNTIVFKGNSIIEPKKFKNVLSKKRQMFLGFSQQDAHETLTLILDEIIEETGLESTLTLNKVPKLYSNYKKNMIPFKKKINEIEIFEENELKKLKEMYGNENNQEYKMGENEISEKVFEFKSKISDNIKNYKINNPEEYKMYLYLEYIKKMYTTKHNDLVNKIRNFIMNERKCPNCGVSSFSFDSVNIINTQMNGNNIYNCLDAFMNNNKTSGRCTYCDKESDMDTVTKIVSSSPMLYISLERFSKTPIMNGMMTRNMMKFNKNENYSFNNGFQIIKNDSDIKIEDEINIEKYCEKILEPVYTKYKLRGIINHFGNCNGGHYTAYCRDIIDDKNWYEFDDSSVSIIKNFEPNGSSAYILFYEAIIK